MMDPTEPHPGTDAASPGPASAPDATSPTPAPGAAAGSPASLGLRVARTTEAVVGRRLHLEAIEQGLAAAKEGLACLSLEGEPGIGKTRLLLAVQELAHVHGLVPVGASGDEEIRGPFLLARSLFAAPPLLEAAERAGAVAELRRLLDALGGPVEAGLESLPPERRLLRVYDLAVVALRAVASGHPLALLLDDVQWADDDSLRLLRYVLRSSGRGPLFLAFAARREELASAEAATGLLADLERMGVLRRLVLSRLTQADSAELLQWLLGGPVQLASAAVMHAQSEGVPFVLHEQVRAYRDAGLIQPIDGVWTLARNAERLLPSAVRTLIQRREARLPEASKRALAEAALLGRDFSLRDLAEVRRRLGGGGAQGGSQAELAHLLAPAVAAGLLAQHPDDSAADYGFTHEQVRDFAAARLSAPERRAAHQAILDLLTAEGEPSAGSLALVARHALAAGKTELGARAALGSARAALAAHAPEEAVRLIEMAAPIAADPRTRVELLRLRDQALEMLRRPARRLEALTELAALAEALGDRALEVEVMLRRSAALRSAGEREGAAELARRIQGLAADRGDRAGELAASLELGQALLGADLGEAGSRAASEADLDGAEAAFQRAVALAEALGDEPRLAAAHRELGIIHLSRLRIWYIETLGTPEHDEMLRRIAAGETPQSLLASLPAGAILARTNEHLRSALEIYERLNDRPGVMNAIIAMALASWAPEIHLAGSAKRIEEIYRLMSRKESFTSESRRALAELQMLLGSHVYARAKVFPDVALAKGRQAYDAARTSGERGVEFTVAGGVALAHAELGQIAEAEGWIERAAQLAREAPSLGRAREIEFWRGAVRAAAGDARGMCRHLEKAARLAEDQGRSADRCGVLAYLACEAARLGAAGGDEDVLALAERSAGEVLQLVPLLPGHPPWGAQARAALAAVHLARGDAAGAAAHGREALSELDAAGREDADLEVVLPACAALLAGGSPEEVERTHARLGLLLGLITQRIGDPAVRVRWFRAPRGRELVRLAGPPAPSPERRGGFERLRLSEGEAELLRHLVEGRTNPEIAEAVGASEGEVERRLAELYVHIGATSRADATAAAFLRSMV